MKKTVLALLASGALSFGFDGCCTAPRASAWEYRDYVPPGTESLDDMTKDGWIVVNGFYNAQDKSDHFLIKRLKTSH